jgi:SPP1 gp7 family putative phage head morphogenesis protein
VEPSRPVANESLAALRAQLLAREREAAERMISAYRRVYQDIDERAQSLVNAIAAQPTPVTGAQMRKMARYKSLMTTIEAQMGRYKVLLDDEVRAAREDALKLGTSGARNVVAEALPVAARASIMATFQALPVGAVEALVAGLMEGSPLMTRTLARYGAGVAERAGDVLVSGLARGIGPRKMASELRTVLGGPLSDALRITRTEVNRAFRQGVLAGYRANPHVVKGWMWHAELDDRTCAACVMLHGTEHPLSESFDDHPNGRCAPLPITVSFRELGIDIEEVVPEVQKGEDWFVAQDEATQRSIMGNATYDAWQDGAITLPQLIGQTDDPQWGRTYHQASLVSLLGDGAQQYYAGSSRDG